MKVLLSTLVAGAIALGGSCPKGPSEDSSRWRWWKDGNRIAECTYAHSLPYWPDKDKWYIKQMWDNEQKCFYVAFNNRQPA